MASVSRGESLTSPGPTEPGNYILNSNEDPCYENVAALGAEYIGYTLAANEQAGALRSLFLEETVHPGSFPRSLKAKEYGRLISPDRCSIPLVSFQAKTRPSIAMRLDIVSERCSAVIYRLRTSASGTPNRAPVMK